MRFSTLLALLLTSAALAAPPSSGLVLNLSVKNDAQAFLKDVARLCLSSAESKIEAVGAQQLKLTERSDICAREIESFATQWDREPGLKTVSVYARPEQKSDLERALRAKYP